MEANRGAVWISGWTLQLGSAGSVCRFESEACGPDNPSIFWCTCCRAQSVRELILASLSRDRTFHRFICTRSFPQRAGFEFILGSSLCWFQQTDSYFHVYHLWVRHQRSSIKTSFLPRVSVGSLFSASFAQTFHRHERFCFLLCLKGCSLWSKVKELI